MDYEAVKSSLATRYALFLGPPLFCFSLFLQDDLLRHSKEGPDATIKVLSLVGGVTLGGDLGGDRNGRGFGCSHRFHSSAVTKAALGLPERRLFRRSQANERSVPRRHLGLGKSKQWQ